MRSSTVAEQSDVRVALAIDERRGRPLLHAELDGDRAHLARRPPIGPVAQASSDAHRPSSLRTGFAVRGFFSLGFLPELVERVQAQRPQLQALLVGEALDPGEARRELATGRP